MRFLALIALACLTLSGAAHAQGAGDLQAVNLFVQTCVRFAGQPVLLQNWAQERELPAAGEKLAADIAAHIPGSQGYIIKTTEAEMVMIASQNGDCRLLLKQGDPNRVEGAVFALMAKGTIESEVIKDEVKDKPYQKVRIYKASLAAKRSWTWAVVSSDNAEQPKGPKEVALITRNISFAQWSAVPPLAKQSHPPSPLPPDPPPAAPK